MFYCDGFVNVLCAFQLKAQVRLDFVDTSSFVNSYSFSEVENPVGQPICGPAENIIDNGRPFMLNNNTGRYWGGAHTIIRRGLPGCKIGASGTANVIIDGAGSNSLFVRWWSNSMTNFNCLDPDCGWFGTDTSSMSAKVQFRVAGIPNGVPVEVSYYWIHFSTIASISEAGGEDYAAIENAALNLFNQTGFGNNMNLAGDIKIAQLRTGDSTSLFTAFNGDTLNIEVSATTFAHIEPPAKTPDNPRTDVASADFYGYVVIVVNAPDSPVVALPNTSCPSGQLLFSVDIGSDTEFSVPLLSGNETLDPGDLYSSLSATPIPFFDDTTIFGFDPNPSLGNPALTCQAGPLQPFQSALNFDLDGADRIDYNFFNNASNYGAGKPSIPLFNSNCINSPDYMLFSVSETNGIPFNNDFVCDLPATINAFDSLMVKGAVNNNDEVMLATLYNLSGTASYFGSAAPYLDEQSLSILLSPSPPSLFPTDFNDDVNALDYIEDPTACANQYFSVDREAHYVHGADTLKPGYIYQVISPGNIAAVITPALHLGLIDDIDINAFEFAWLFDSTQQRNGLALVFSVNRNDPSNSSIDYTGGLDPEILYASFLDGAHFEMLPSLSTGNIDAITFLCGPINAYGSTYTPPSIIVGTPEKAEQVFDVQLYPNPNNGLFNIEFSLLEKFSIEIVVTDISGKQVLHEKESIFSAGRQKITIPAGDVGGGIYFVEMKTVSGAYLNTIRRKISVFR